MLIKIGTGKTVSETAVALQAAVQANHFGVMQVHNLKETMAKKGVECHALAAFVNVRGKDGEYLVKGKRVTGFTNAEEKAVGLAEVVPFLLEDRLKERGGLYSKGANWAPHVRADGKLVTGQNPASSGPAAKALLTLLHSISTRS